MISNATSIIRHSVGDEFLHPLLVERIDEALTAAKRDLAVKVLAAVEAEERSRFGKGATGVSSAVRDLFVAEGINLAPLTARKEKEGE